MIHDLLVSLRAEILKLNRTLALWMVLITPLIVVALPFYIAYDRGAQFSAQSDGWALFAQMCTSMWAVFMLPLFITLETALSNQLEHTAKAWKNLFALPLARGSIYTAKLLVAFGMIAVSTIVLGVGIAVAGTALSIIRPNLHISPYIPVGLIIEKAFLPFFASWLIIAFHFWLSARWQGFVVSLGTGIGAVFFTVFASGATLGKFYPWLLPVNALSDERRFLALLIGITGGILVSLIGAWDISRRDVL